MPRGKSPNFLGVMSSDASKVGLASGRIMSMRKPLGTNETHRVGESETEKRNSSSESEDRLPRLLACSG